MPDVSDVIGCADRAVGPTGLVAALPYEGQVVNIEGRVAFQSTTCEELASAAVDPEVITSDLVGGRQDGDEHDFVEDSTIHGETASGIAAFAKAAVGDLDEAASNAAAGASMCARRQLFEIADAENSKFNADVWHEVCWSGSFLLRCRGRLGVVALGAPVCCSFVRDILQSTP